MDRHGSPACCPARPALASVFEIRSGPASIAQFGRPHGRNDVFMEHGSNEPAHWKGIMRGALDGPDPYAIGRTMPTLAVLFRNDPLSGCISPRIVLPTGTISKSATFNFRLISISRVVFGRRPCRVQRPVVCRLSDLAMKNIRNLHFPLRIVNGVNHLLTIRR